MSDFDGHWESYLNGEPELGNLVIYDDRGTVYVKRHIPGTTNPPQYGPPMKATITGTIRPLRIVFIEILSMINQRMFDGKLYVAVPPEGEIEQRGIIGGTFTDVTLLIEGEQVTIRTDDDGDWMATRPPIT